MKYIIDNIDSAIGTFWGCSFFIGALISVLIGKSGNGRSDWFWAILIGILIFLILGLLIQGILTLFRKDR